MLFAGGIRTRKLSDSDRADVLTTEQLLLLKIVVVLRVIKQ